MPIYMEVSQLHRTVTIVARGQIAPDEIRGMAMKLAEAKVRSYAKILEVAGATTDFTVEQIERLSSLLRGASSEKRGPIAFVVDPRRMAFPQAFASQTEAEGPIKLFTSLRDARKWTETIIHSPEWKAAVAAAAAAPPPPANQNAWTDPDRQGVLLVGDRQREVTVSLEKAA
ncbi:MAG TPA: hypothetical protein VFB13_06180 [Reyranella sp.]|jgi:hypothetical protein|nr:hypothetical protein [Reyranella sp.]